MLRVAPGYFTDTDTGRARRANEDSFYARPPLFVVADGMGGAQAGEVASSIAVEHFAGGLPEGAGSVASRLAARVADANQAIHERSLHDADVAGMGTTLTAAYVGPGEVTIAHVGDSRAYRWRDGTLERLTEDHSLVEELMRQGRLTPEEADDHPQRSIITRALGPEAVVEVDTFTAPARDGDVFLLCSDGLTSMVGEDAIARVLREAPDLRRAGAALIAAANDAGGRDNITVLLFAVEEVGEGPPPAEHATTAAHAVPAPSRAGAAGTVAERRPQRRAAVAARRRPARRRRRLVTGGAILAVLVVAAVAAGLYVALTSLYFIGTDAEGRVALFRGVPYELPFGIDLYTKSYTSGVTAAALPPARRGALLDHDLRSHDDAVDLLRQLELGRLQPAA